ncbi:rhomboid family intramembrane serine protease [Brumimicrobium glaciale]|jgi:membrane associated rhomboid family serine protease|uniref:Rhomboid family intramembrane serine protease n=1 Tax=Brumimicrobium glaciale TaxID=200475 RepID=A0A4Q4KLR3_9FLAO|nr:rhomboid family intramembrane serine protease [Brumimicrobium glaciale]RYM33314.1 rhomboid family intramembrane serine protease [Brumimicrobium glaciale]
MELQNYPVTIVIIIATVLISLRAFKDGDFKYKWIFYPFKVKRENEFYRIISHIFIHGDTMHLIFNMFVLFSFGGIMEFIFSSYFGVGLGSLHFVLLYFLGGLAASIWPYLRNKDNPNYMSLGASGAVSAVLFASILWMPEGGIYLLFIPFEIPAWLFGILYLGFEYYMSKKGGTGIAHDAHFGGAIFGILYVLIINFPKGAAFFEYILS